jgi:uncharacterized membrane protein
MDHIIGIGIISILILTFIGIIIIAKTVLRMDKEEIRELISLTLIMSVTGALIITAIIKGVLIWN